MTWRTTLTPAEFGKLLGPDRDSITHLREVYDEAVNALHSAGTDRMKRRQLEKMAIQHIGDLVRQLEYWRDEAVQDELRRTWSEAIRPPSTPPPTPDERLER